MDDDYGEGGLGDDEFGEVDADADVDDGEVSAIQQHASSANSGRICACGDGAGPSTCTDNISIFTWFEFLAAGDG